MNEPEFNIADISDDYFKHYPPGVLMQLTEYIYKQAPLPVYEIALTGALGLFAGIVGRQYNFSNDGLNQYLMLVAGTGRGKEAIAKGIDRIISELAKRVPHANNIIGPAEMASGQALLKYLSARKGPPCFVSIFGEIGYKLHQINNPKATPAEQMLQRVLLDLYNKSGEGRLLQPSIYADKINNTEQINSPAFTLIGESTGERFYSSLDEKHVSIGLLPRFTIIEYDGPVVDYNEYHANIAFPQGMIDKLEKILLHCYALADNSNETIVIQIEASANVVLSGIRTHVKNTLNAKRGGLVDELWNRTAQKTHRLAALLAVSHDYTNPIISRDMVLWAASLVITDTKRLLAKFDAGEMGIVDESDNTKQIDEIRKVLRRYLLKEPNEYSDQKIRQMREKAIISYAFIQNRVVKLACFRKDRRKPLFAIKATLQSMCDLGYIRKLNNGELRAFDNNYGGEAYIVIDPKWVFGESDNAGSIPTCWQ